MFKNPLRVGKAALIKALRGFEQILFKKCTCKSIGAYQSARNEN